MNRRLLTFFHSVPMFVVAVLGGVIAVFAPACSGSEWAANRDPPPAAVTRSECR